jgi:hypothetical protein
LKCCGVLTSRYCPACPVLRYVIEVLWCMCRGPQQCVQWRPFCSEPASYRYHRDVTCIVMIIYHPWSQYCNTDCHRTSVEWVAFTLLTQETLSSYIGQEVGCSGDVLRASS